MASSMDNELVSDEQQKPDVNIGYKAESDSHINCSVDNADQIVASSTADINNSSNVVSCIDSSSDGADNSENGIAEKKC